MNRLSKVYAVLIVVLLVLPCSLTAQDFNRGKEYLDKGQYDQAISVFNEILRRNPKDTDALIYRGNAYTNKGDYDKAIADYTAALRIDPNLAAAYYNRGVAYTNKGDYDKAIADYTAAIRIDPNFASAYNNRGSAYGKKGDYDKAIADYTAAIRIDPNHDQAYYNRGSAYINKGDYDKAIADFTATLRINPNDAQAYAYRGIAYINKGDYDKAIADFTAVLRIDSNLDFIYFIRGYAYSQIGKNQEAIQDLEKAIALDPNYQDAKDLLNLLKSIDLLAAMNSQPGSNIMVKINGGSFMMGSPNSEAGRQDNEGPQHRVTLSSFYIGKYEVTQKEYLEVMGINPSRHDGDTRPVENVTWYNAIAYCNALSKKEGLTPAYTVNGETVTWNRKANGYRLPTEAEWEYACRAGTTTPYYSGNSVDEAAWYFRNIGNQTHHPVGQKKPNTWELYDMHGNVWEWCWDWYADYTANAQTDPMGPATGANRVARGGSWWTSGTPDYRSAFRWVLPPSGSYFNGGFRVARNGN